MTLIILFIVGLVAIWKFGAPPEHGCIPRAKGIKGTFVYVKRSDAKQCVKIEGEIADCLCGKHFVLLPPGFPRKWEEVVSDRI